MHCVGFDALGPDQIAMISSSVTNPPMYIVIRGHEADSGGTTKYQFEIGIKQNDIVKLKTVLKRYSELEEFDKLMRKYFKDSKFLIQFPPRKFFGNTETHFVEQRQGMLQQYIDGILKIPGIQIFPPFCSIFEIEVSNFVQS